MSNSEERKLATVAEIKEAISFARARGAVALDGVPVALLEELFAKQCPCPACVELAFEAIHRNE